MPVLCTWNPFAGQKEAISVWNQHRSIRCSFKTIQVFSELLWEPWSSADQPWLLGKLYAWLLGFRNEILALWAVTVRSFKRDQTVSKWPEKRIVCSVRLSGAIWEHLSAIQQINRVDCWPEDIRQSKNSVDRVRGRIVWLDVSKRLRCFEFWSDSLSEIATVVIRE